jgi:hemerythrin-like domain-containing protein
MNPVQTLRREHALIETALEVLREMATRVVLRQPVPSESVLKLIRFFRSFADGIHHTKEEGALFPALVAAGMPEKGGPLAFMMHEHDEGRVLLARLEAAVQDMDTPEGRHRFHEAAATYRDLVWHHIARENQILLPMAERMLTPELAAQVAARFEEYDRGSGAERVRREERRWLEELEVDYLGVEP